MVWGTEREESNITLIKTQVVQVFGLFLFLVGRGLVLDLGNKHGKQCYAQLSHIHGNTMFDPLVFLKQRFPSEPWKWIGKEEDPGVSLACVNLLNFPRTSS